MTRIDDKIEEISKFVAQLESFIPPDFESYEQDY